MKWQSRVLLFFIILLTSLGVQAYSSEDLWLVQIVVNDDLATGQIVDVLILEDDIFLPVVRLANILQIPLNVDYTGGKISFLRPNDQTEIWINSLEQQILVSGKGLENANQIYNLAGDFYLSGENLGQLMDAQVRYNQRSLICEIQTEHLAKPVKEEFNPFTKISEKKEETIISPLTISNIQYKFTAGWSKRKDFLGCEFPDDFPQNEQEELVLEAWETRLNLGMKGTIYDWEYQLSSVLSKEDNQDITVELDRVLLTYDLDRACFQLGTLNVETEETVVLEDTPYNGILWGSRTSPLERSNGNIIQVRGEAEPDSTVTLFVNGWKRGSQKVKETGKYLFRDVILFQNKRANELKIVIEKINGLVEVEYRYIAVSEGILNPGEINYLSQIGRMRAGQKKPYLLNGIAYWGVTDNTTLGMAWYGEFSEDDQVNLFNYNSFRINQRIDKNNLVRGLFYHIQSLGEQAEEKDIGYKINYDYQGKNTLAGLMYHKEGEQYHLNDDERVDPLEIYKAFYIKDVTPETFLECKYTRYQLTERPAQRDEIYELSLNVEKASWLGMVGFKQNISKHENSVTNIYHSTIAHQVLSDLELTNELEYQTHFQDNQTAEEIHAGVGGIYYLFDHQCSLGVNWAKNCNQNSQQWDYSLGWSKGWNLKKNCYLNAAVSYNLTDGDNTDSQKVPIQLGYTQTLANDLNLNLEYVGSYEKIADNESIDHKVTLSLEGACNFFDGKIVSTSPLSIGTQIGIVSGTVYQDSNRNGQFDVGEVTLVGIPVKLGTRVQLSNEKGEFIFKNITAGTYTLSFDYQKLPIELTPTLADQKIQVRANGETRVELGLYIVGSVDGRVQIKALDQLQHYPLTQIKVIAEPGGYSTLTDQSGYYFFDQLPAGNYQVSLDVTSLPEWAILEVDRLYEIQITEKGEYINGLDYFLDIDPEFLAKYQIEETDEIEISGLEKIDLEEDGLLIIDLLTKKAKYNGSELYLYPFIYQSNDIYWLPLKAIFKAFGAGVYWNANLKQIHILEKGNKIILDIEHNYAEVNNQKLSLENEIIIKNWYSYITKEDIEKLGLEFELANDVIYIKKNEEFK